MYVIMDTTSGYYFHQEGKIILFEQPEEAQWFLQSFQQYAIARHVQEQQSPFAIMESQQIISNLAVVQKDFLEKPPPNVVSLCLKIWKFNLKIYKNFVIIFI